MESYRPDTPFSELSRREKLLVVIDAIRTGGLSLRREEIIAPDSQVSSEIELPTQQEEKNE